MFLDVDLKFLRNRKGEFKPNRTCYRQYYRLDTRGTQVLGLPELVALGQYEHAAVAMAAALTRGICDHGLLQKLAEDIEPTGVLRMARSALHRHPLLSTVLDALARHRSVKIELPAAEFATYDPIFVWWDGEEAHLVARQFRTSEKPRDFRLCDISNCTLEDLTSSVRDEERACARDAIADAWLGHISFNESRHDVRLRVNRLVLQDVQRLCGDCLGNPIRCSNNTLVLSYSVRCTDGLDQLVRRFWPHVKVIEPHTIQQRIEQSLVKPAMEDE